MISFRKIITLIIPIILFHEMLFAQTQKEDTTHATISKYESPAFCIRATGGLGIASTYLMGIAYGRIDIRNVFFSLRTCTVDDLSGLGNESPSESYYDYCFITGISLISKNFYISIGIGISKATVVEHRPYYIYGANINYNIKKSTWGFPGQIEFMFIPSKFIGLGLVFLSDINSIHTFGGGAFCIQVGWLR